MWTQGDYDRIEEKRQAAELAEMKRTTRGLWASAVGAVLLIIAYRAIFPGSAFTLCRAAEDDPTSRAVVATFNSEEGAEANKANCEAVSTAMQQQKPAYKVRYTCERGRW